ncbi:hypothetical protein [Rhizobium hidalgonense]|nr:hypothetical protein [Rhizobium hidalgonense]
MGGAKRLMAEREEIRSWAEGVLIEHGAASVSISVQNSPLIGIQF